MLQQVHVANKSLSDYLSITPRHLTEEIATLAKELSGLRVLHVNATSFGGGVAEILYSLVPLMNDVGIKTDWKVLFGREEFFEVTKNFHNALQGADFELDRASKEIFENYSQLNAQDLGAQDYDIVVSHDPQPVALRAYLPESQAHWVWRCHIDTTNANTGVSDYLSSFYNLYDHAIFTLPEYVPSSMQVPTSVVAPAIDPISPKNMLFSREDASYIVRQFGVDVTRPLLLQVSRFDPWKDPQGVIDVYRLLKGEFPDLQLALIGSMASDDPEGWEFFSRTVDYARADPDIYILSNVNNVGAVEVAAFQCYASVVLQKSIREGFGLTVSEALWKGRPTVAGRVGGIPLQIEDGKTGYLVESVKGCAQAVSKCMRRPEEALKMGLAGKEYVRTHFLTPRLLRDDLALFAALTGKAMVGA